MTPQLRELARNTTPADEIGQHVLATYKTLRWGLGLLALAFPLVLVAYGAFLGIELQPSLSAYYYAASGGADCVRFPTRPVFVGMLCAIAVGLYLYKGFTNLENLLLNAAAVCGVVVAWAPERLIPAQVQACNILAPVLQSQGSGLSVHWVAAVLLFVCLGAVAWFCADKTLAFLPAPHRDSASMFRRAYRGLAVCMVAGPLLAVVLVNLVAAHYVVIAVEWVGIWTFAAYWLVKSYELMLSHAQEKAAQDQVPQAVGAA